MLKDLLSIEETADYLGVSITTVRRMLTDGRLRGSRLGRVWRIPREAVQELVRSGAASQGDAPARVYILLERHRRLAPLFMDRRVAAFTTIDGAKAQAAKYAEERGETIQGWEIERQYLYETRWLGETGAEHSYVIVMTRVMDS